MLSNVTKAMVEHGLLGAAPWPPASWTPTTELKVHYNEAEVCLGNGIESELAKSEPTLYFLAKRGVTYTVELPVLSSSYTCMADFAVRSWFSW